MTKCRVQLRNGLVAVVELLGNQHEAQPVGLFVWLAYGTLRQFEPGTVLGTTITEGYPVADLWTATGRWREDGSTHPLDIVLGLEESA